MNPAELVRTDVAAAIAGRLLAVREAAPLVLNVTNYVVMNNTANALLALGASPLMAHAPEEMTELVGLASALVINIGTLSRDWVDSMLIAGKAAVRRGIPVVFDPVGCGASAFRTETSRAIVEAIHPTIIRGNASEIAALAGSDVHTKGVDSLITPDAITAGAARLAQRSGSIVSISGAEDLIVDGETATRLANGHPMMARITGTGCTASAITGAFAAICPTPFEAAVTAMAVIGIAGEIAAEDAAGPGSLQLGILDTLYRLGERDITSRLRLTHHSAAPSQVTP